MGGSAARNHRTGKSLKWLSGPPIAVNDRLWCAAAVAILILAGCASIPNVPTQNILMFNSDGEPVDPTGNLDCPEPALVKSTLCNEDETRHAFREYHLSGKGRPKLSDRYYQSSYLRRLFDCMYEHFRAPSPNDLQPPSCKQKPPLPPPTTPPDVKRVLIFVHGGMNSEVESLERVVKLYNQIAQKGWYPLFINWRSSFVSSYLEQLANIRQGEDVGWTGFFTLPVVLGIDVARSIARAPLVWIAQTANDAKAVPLLSFLAPKDPNKIAIELICAYEYADQEEECQKKTFRKPPICVPFNVRSGDAGPHFPKQEYPNPNRERLNKDAIQISVGEDLRGCSEMDVSFVMYGVTIPSRLLLDPAVDALGTSAWDNMLRRTRLLFTLDDEFRANPTFLHKARLAKEYEGALANIPRSGGISIFLRQLAERITNDGGKWEITLVGHSMGAIILNQILRESMQLELKLPITNIVYMASAASVRDTLDSVLPFLQQDDKAKFYNLTLHPVAEERESYEPRAFRIPVGPGPRGSLLVMIDNFLSAPLTYLDRTAGRYENFLLAVHAIPLNLRPRVHIKTFSVGSSDEIRAENPQRHSDFTERFKFWIEECWKPGPAMEKMTPRDCMDD